MKSIYLFPNRLKMPALIAFVASIILIILYYSDIKIEIPLNVFAFVSDNFLSKAEYFSFVEQDIYNEILDCTFFISGMILAFSKEKVEDENDHIHQVKIALILYLFYIVFIDFRRNIHSWFIVFKCDCWFFIYIYYTYQYFLLHQFIHLQKTV